MKIFHYITISFFLAWSNQPLVADNTNQKINDFQKRLEQAQALLEGIKTKSAEPSSDFSSDLDHSRTGFISSPRNQTLPLSRTLKIKDLRERVNRAESLLDSVRSPKVSGIPVAPVVNPQDLPPRPPLFESVQDQATQSLSARNQSLPLSRTLKIKNLRERVNRAESLLDSVRSPKLSGMSVAPVVNPQDLPPRPPLFESEQDQTPQSLSASRDIKVEKSEEREEGGQSAPKSTGVGNFLDFQPEVNRSVQAVPVSEPDLFPESEPLKPDVDELNTAELFEELDRNSSFEEMYLPNGSKEFELHEVRFLYSYVYPFSSTYISTGGEGVPLDYNSGFQGEIQYLYNLSFLSLGCSVLWSEQSHKALGPLSFVGSLEASGETRSFGGSLLAGLSTDLGDHFSVESVLSLGLVRRLDKFQMAGVYMSEAGNAFIYSLSVGLHYHFFTDYKLGLFAKYQDMAGLSRNSDSQTVQVGATIGVEF